MEELGAISGALTLLVNIVMAWNTHRLMDRLTLPLQQRLRARARELAVEWRDINGLVPYARNARTHSEAQIAQIAGSIREFGFTNPVLIDPEGGIFGQFTSLPASMIRPPSPTR